MPAEVPATRRRRTLALVGSALVLVLAAVGYLAFGGARHGITAAPPPPPGCQAGAGVSAIPLDTGQAGIAATIAGVAARHRLPRQAVTIALAAALQESQLQNLDYGDRDSVGVFQQRPSQGWGTAAELEDPVYATTKFFAALVRVRGYTKMPVDQAAQDVQHSADGYAYGQWTAVATLLAGYFTGAPQAGVSCWYTPPARPDLAGALKQLTETFGPQGKDGVLVGITTGRSGQKKKDGRVAVVHVQQAGAWTVAGWLVAHAQQYGISQIRYAGYVWTAGDGSMGWQRAARTASPVPRGSIVAAYLRAPSRHKRRSGHTVLTAGQEPRRSSPVTYIIAQPCVDVLDKACIEECPVDCIYEGDRMLYIHPDECVDCGACEPVCPVEAIYYEDDVPEQWKEYYKVNVDFFADLGSPGGASKTGRTGKDHPVVAALPPQAAEE